LGPLSPQHYSCTEVLCAKEERKEIGNYVVVTVKKKKKEKKEIMILKG